MFEVSKLIKKKTLGKIKRYIACGLICMLLLITGCGQGEGKQSSSSVQKEESDHLVVGFSIDSYLIERWQRDTDVFVAKIKELDSNAEVNLQNANGDIETQKEQIKYLIEKKVDVLVIVCIDSESLSGVVSEAKNAGIPVIAYDRLIKNAKCDLYLSFDNEKVGTLMGQALIDAGLPNKKVMMLSGPNEDNNVSLVEKGFRTVMNDNDVEIVDVYHTPAWKAEDAAAYVSEHLSEMDDVDAIMCGNDNIATMVTRTLSEARLAGKIKIVGQDADLEACQRVVEGIQVMTVYKPVEKLAQTAAEYAVALANGQTIDEVADAMTGTVSDGSYDIPYCYLDPIAVTKDNMDSTVIASGFHMKDEVYMNVTD